MTDYYVDATGGDDTKSGLSPATAWQTIPKVNSKWSSFAPGDNVRFKAGETWNVTSTANWLRPMGASGTSGHPITVTRYDSGANPKLLSTGPTCIRRYYADPAADWVVIEHFEITGSDNQAAISLQTSDHYVFRDLHVHDITTAWCAGIRIQKMLDILIEDCIVEDIDGEGIYISTSGDNLEPVEDVTILRCLIQNTDNNGIDLKAPARRVNVIFCTLIDASGPAEFQMIAAGGADHWFYGNYLEANVQQPNIRWGIALGHYSGELIGVTRTRHVVERCFFKNIGASAQYGAISASGEGDEIRGNQFDGCNVGIYISTAGLDATATHRLYGNLFMTNTHDVYQASSKYTSDFSRFADADCTWYYSGADRNLAYVQGTLGEELHASVSVAMAAEDILISNDEPVQTNAFLAADGHHCFMAAEGISGEAACLRHTECAGLTQAQINALLAERVTDFSGLSATVDQLSPLRVKSEWQF